jgi:phthalate 4,5-dioxygenase reductase subunit
MKELCGEKLTLHFSQELGNTQFDFWDLLMSPTKEHVYCCGPNGLMEEIKGVTGHWPEGHIHFEEFQPVDVIRDDDKSFTVVLNKSGDEIKIPSDRTILEGLRDSGYNFPSSCENGSCGTCKCQVIDGEVDHRDIVLMNDEKDSTIMLCVSRAKGERLVLDL